MLLDVTGDRRHETGDAALHVDGAASVHFAFGDRGGEGRSAPGGLVADRHHIGVAGEHQMRSFAPDPGVKVLDIGRSGFLRHDPVDLEADRSKHGFKSRKRTSLGGCDGGAANEGSEIGDGIGREHGRYACEAGGPRNGSPVTEIAGLSDQPPAVTSMNRADFAGRLERERAGQMSGPPSTPFGGREGYSPGARCGASICAPVCFSGFSPESLRMST